MVSRNSGIKLSGTRDLAIALKGIPRRSTRVAVLRSSARAGARLFLKAARRNARKHKDDGILDKSFKAQLEKSNKQRGKIVAGSTAPHAHLIEHGTGPRETKDGKSTGSVQASPFARPAFDQTKGQSLAAMQKQAIKRFNAEADKFARKARARLASRRNG